MCGIVAINSKNGLRLELSDALDAIQHRGPDGKGIFVSDTSDCHLGHVRLSIIDLSNAGAQPMSDASGRFVIVYNGEIYNFKDLREELNRTDGAIAWKSSSDTEVIIEGYARQGVSFLDKLNGIFALAIYDRYEHTLSVLRDPLGIKPVFFTRQRGNIYFGSELKALLAMPALNRTVRRQSFAEQLSFMYVPEPYTRFEEFLKLEPGLFITYREGEIVASKKLFQWIDAPIEIKDECEAVDAFSSAFSKAVQRQLTSDAPVSLMLSGGLDSSAVAFEVARNGGVITDAYTIAFNSKDMAHDQQSDDLHYARIVARQFGLKLEVIPAESDFISLLPSLSKYMEDGVSDPAAINTYLICQAARDKGVKVMLTGQGADEYLGGYRRYQAERMISQMPSLIRRLIHVVGRSVPDRVPGRFNALARRISRMSKLAGQTREQRLLSLYTWTEPEELRSLFASSGITDSGRTLMALFNQHSILGDVEAMMRVDRHYDLLSLNLTYTDRLSMAAGVEARVPFLDLELVRLMSSIPMGLKIRGHTSKFILKKAMEPHLPREVVYREKAGFSLPIRAWLRTDSEIMRYYFDKSRIDRQGIFNSEVLQTFCDRHFSGVADYSSFLFSMLCIQTWLEDQSGAYTH